MSDTGKNVPISIDSIHRKGNRVNYKGLKAVGEGCWNVLSGWLEVQVPDNRLLFKDYSILYRITSSMISNN